MKKVMISQPMRGKTEEEIRKERGAVIEALKNRGYDVIDTVYPDFHPNPDQKILIKYLAKNINFVAESDVVCFMEGWDAVRGCIIEHSVCRAYNIEILYAHIIDGSVVLRTLRDI